MYALSCTVLFGAGHGIVSPRQANFEQGTAASAQKTNFLRVRPPSAS